jgi:hypothetical protein
MMRERGGVRIVGTPRSDPKSFVAPTARGGPGEDES